MEGRPVSAVVDDQYQILESFFQNEGMFPDETEHSRPALLKLYRLLASGHPVEVAQLAQALDMEISTVRTVLDAVPASNIAWNNACNITGYRGLGLSETKHRLTIDQNTLFAWCAFDCLFLPELLNRNVEVTSLCPETGDEIFLKFQPGGLVSTVPDNLYLSFVLPNLEAYHDDLIGNFCCHVHFFANRQAGEMWTGNKSDIDLITLEQGLKLAEIRNQKGFGSVLQ